MYKIKNNKLVKKIFKLLDHECGFMIIMLILYTYFLAPEKLNKKLNDLLVI